MKLFVVFRQLSKSKTVLVLVIFKRAREVWGNSGGSYPFFLAGFILNWQVLKFLGGSPQTVLKVQRVRCKNLADQGSAGVLLRGVIIISQLI